MNLYFKTKINQKARRKATTASPHSVQRSLLWIFVIVSALDCLVFRMHLQFSAMSVSYTLDPSSKFHCFHLDLKLQHLSSQTSLTFRLWHFMLKYHLVYFSLCCFSVVRAHAKICEDSGFTSSCFLLLSFCPEAATLDPFLSSAWIGAHLAMLFL